MEIRVFMVLFITWPPFRLRCIILNITSSPSPPPCFFKNHFNTWGKTVQKGFFNFFFFFLGVQYIKQEHIHIQKKNTCTLHIRKKFSPFAKWDRLPEIQKQPNPLFIIPNMFQGKVILRADYVITVI